MDYYILNLKNFVKALDCFLKTDSLTEKLLKKGDIQYAFIYNSLADAYCGLKQFPLAISYYNMALELFLKNNFIDEASVIYHNLGITYFKTKDFSTAEDYYKHSLEISKHVRPTNNIYTVYTHQRLGELYLHQKRYALAVSHYSASIKELRSLSRDTNKGDALFPVDNILSKSNLFESLYFKGRCELYQYYEKKERDMLQKSVNSFKEALLILDVIRNQYNFEKTMLSLNKMSIPLINSYIYSLLLLNEINPCLENDNRIIEAIDRTKYTALRTLMQTTKYDPDSHLPVYIRECIDSLYKSIRYSENLELNGQLDNRGEKQSPIVRNQLFESIYSLDTLVYSLKQQYPDFNKDIYNFSFYKINDIQALLPDSTGIIEYFHNDSIIIIVAINKYQYQITHSICEADLTNKKNILRKSIIFSNNSEFRQTSEYFYSELIEPIYHTIKELKKIIIIPDMFFSGFPFETLSRSKNKDENSSESAPDYLIKHFDLSYHFSLSLWGDYTTLYNKTPNIMWESDFSGFAPLSKKPNNSNGLYLSHSKEEIESIAKIFIKNGGKIKTYNNTESTEEAISNELRNSRIVHIASHANSIRQENSFIEVNNTGNSINHKNKNLFFFPDGNLNLFEIYNLDVTSELVTLSVCSSGFGKHNIGEGIASLSHGFYYSGARNILYTLWNVSDFHSKAFMIKFYQYLNLGYSYSQALRKAKLDFINSGFSLPVFWSGYLLNG